MRPVVVGISPPKHTPSNGDDWTPFCSKNSASGRQLAGLLGARSVEDFMFSFDRVNLHGDDEPVTNLIQSDRQCARNLAPILRGRRVVFVGRRVADAFGIKTDPDMPIASWGSIKLPGGEYCVGAVIPHPSGRNILYNDPATVAIIRDRVGEAGAPCVHVEGPDGSGKTRTVASLQEYGFLRPVPTEGPPKTLDECERRIAARVAPGIVADRSSGLISELVYAPVCRDGVLGGDERWYWDRLRGMYESTRFVYCRPAVRRHEPREGEDDEHLQSVADNDRALADRYDEVFGEMIAEGARVVEFDYMRRDYQWLWRQICAG